MSKLKTQMTAAPAIGMTAVSMVLTLAVVLMWLGGHMPWYVALVVGVGLDGGWLATLAYERRLAAQGDRSLPVTVTGWAFGAAATTVLVLHAVGEPSPGPWLAVSWLPLAAKLLWLVHGLWEETALTPKALDAIHDIRQEARDAAAVARARLRAEATTEETRVHAVTRAGADVARATAQAAERLSSGWGQLEATHQGSGHARALTCVTERVTPPSQEASQPRWELPVWGPTVPVPALEEAPVLSDEELDQVVAQLRSSEVPPLTYREMAVRFRDAGHQAGERRLRAAWKRVESALAVDA